MRLPESVDLEKLRMMQKLIAGKAVFCDDFEKLEIVGGGDASYMGDRAFGAMVTFRGREILEKVFSRTKAFFPYIPTYLSFREMKPLLECYRKLEAKPDLIFFDGQGRAHPRRCGLATHLGVMLDVPSIGVAKSRLCGEHRPLRLRRGAFEYLRHQGEIVGAAVCTRDGTKPVYVSPGHRVSLKTAIKLTLEYSRSRIPEPVRCADALSRECRE